MRAPAFELVTGRSRFPYTAWSARSPDACRRALTRSSGSGARTSTGAPVAGCSNASRAACRNCLHSPCLSARARTRGRRPPGWPIASRCARIWCVRPVSSVTRSSVSSGSARSVSKWVTAWCGSSVSVEIRVRTRRSRPSGASIVPRRAGGRPSTSARYSRVISRARSAACSAAWVARRAPAAAGRTCRGRAGARRPGARGPARRPRGRRAPARACPRALPVPGMDDDARRLVDHEQVLVLVGDPEPRRRDVGARRRLRLGSHVDRLAAGEHVALGLGRAVDAHEPGVDQPLRLARACRRASARKTSSRSPAASGTAPRSLRLARARRSARSRRT